ncbi:MAG: hypothetical protein KatS3mg130_0044 [Candidatus Sumerlaea sp.]|nr:MAG: hypothetical protein KatS3mg130_0044 [Candidatus Sumerlaea sp.]
MTDDWPGWRRKVMAESGVTLRQAGGQVLDVNLYALRREL